MRSIEGWEYILDQGGDRQREESVLGVNLGHPNPIVTNGDFATSSSQIT